MKTDKLKPCPFCGKKPKISEGLVNHQAPGIYCRTCRFIFGRWDIKNAIKDWNKRSTK